MAKEDDRHSKPGDGLEVAGTPQEVALVEAENALRQFDRLRQLIGEAVRQPPYRLRVSSLLELNRLAIQRLHPQAGAYRTVPITIVGGSKHIPPPWQEVPEHVDDMVDYVNAHGDQPAVHLAAYVMWRLNWIHPFYDGNGRTTRAASYLMLCARLGYEIPGTKTIPEIIATSKQPYYDALDEADAHWAAGRLDVSAMERLLEGALAAQLASIVDDARAERRGGRPAVSLPGVRATDGRPTAPTSGSRNTFWGRQPAWFRIASAIGGVGLLLIGAVWQLLTNWDNPRVKQVRDWVIERFESPPAATTELPRQTPSAEP